MDTYLGVNVIKAEKMNRAKFISTIRNEDLKSGIEYEDGYRIQHLNSDGIVSEAWLSKDSFECIYRKISEDEMNLINQ